MYMRKITSPRWKACPCAPPAFQTGVLACAVNILQQAVFYLVIREMFARLAGKVAFPAGLYSYCTYRFCREDNFLCVVAIFQMNLPFVMTSKLGMSCSLKKRLLESARHRLVWTSSGWAFFCFWKSELGDLGHLYCTRCMSLLTALPCLPALSSSSSALPRHCHLLIAGRGGVLVCIPNLKHAEHLCCANTSPLNHTKVGAKKVPSNQSSNQMSQWSF